MRSRWGFYTGLSLVALITLALEVINARLFSVITWYHLSFVAISIAMLGMTAGAIYVYLRPGSFEAERVPQRLSMHTLLFALSIPICHILNISFRPGHEIWSDDPYRFLQLILLMISAAIPFFFSGVIIALSLTRVRLPIGRIYFFDLLGACAGCLLAIVILQSVDPSSGLILLGALGGAAALAYAWHARGKVSRAALALMVMVTLAFAWLGYQNAILYPKGIRLVHSKGRDIPADAVYDRWNTHSRVIVRPIFNVPPYYWGPGTSAPQDPIRWAFLNIDGEAATFISEFRQNDLRQIDWIRHDVTSLAYRLHRNADVAVIGVGGGRDILTALLFNCRHVTGIELNQIFIDLLRNEYRLFSQIAMHPRVSLVHDEGRSYIARCGEKFDLIQMSLIDTWASTSAGGMTLGENGLYTVEAWRTMLRHLEPEGAFTVSRWFSPEDLGETVRLVSLATASLMREGTMHPAEHIILASAGQIGTIILSPSPFSPQALATIRSACARFGFDLILFPGSPVPDRRLEKVLRVSTADELGREITDPVFDLSPPYDERPFFFNLIKPQTWLTSPDIPERTEGALKGNLVATKNLMIILLSVALLVVLSIVLPLIVFGKRHGLDPKRFAAAAHYFSAIGLGFMLIEIGLIQRFSILLGHPIYSLAIILSSMILFTGVGSLVSDRLEVSGRKLTFLLPSAIFLIVIATIFSIQGAIDASISAELPVRVLVTLLFCVPVGFVLGFCFPIGMRLVQERSGEALPWLWGINGAFGVLGGVVAVILSMAWGISWSLATAGFCYLSLILPIHLLRQRRGGT